METEREKKSGEKGSLDKDRNFDVILVSLSEKRSFFLALFLLTVDSCSFHFFEKIYNVEKKEKDREREKAKDGEKGEVLFYSVSVHTI